MAKMNFTPADDMKDELWGPVGTPERDAMEAQLKEDIQAYFVGEAIKRRVSNRTSHKKSWAKESE